MVLRKYGPCPIHGPCISVRCDGRRYAGRSHYDAVTKFITDQIDKAMPNLPDRWTGGDWGRVDKVVAKATKRGYFFMRHLPNGMEINCTNQDG